jgi:hypothetical protein
MTRTKTPPSERNQNFPPFCNPIIAALITPNFSIEAGKFVRAKPGTAVFQLDADFIALPSPLYESVLKALGSKRPDYVPCNSSGLF